MYRFSLSLFHLKEELPLLLFYISPYYYYFKNELSVSIIFRQLDIQFHTRDGFVLLLQVHHLYQSLPCVALIMGLKHSKSIEQFSLAFS